jgi:hypothetical protein
LSTPHTELALSFTGILILQSDLFLEELSGRAEYFFEKSGNLNELLLKSSVVEPVIFQKKNDPEIFKKD